MYVYIWALACTHWAEQEINEKQTKQEKNITAPSSWVNSQTTQKLWGKKKQKKSKTFNFAKTQKVNGIRKNIYRVTSNFEKLERVWYNLWLCTQPECRTNHKPMKHHTTPYPASCLPRLPAWKLSNGEMRSIWATNLERGKIERSALMRSTAWRNASSWWSSEGWKSPPEAKQQHAMDAKIFYKW